MESRTPKLITGDPCPRGACNGTLTTYSCERRGEVMVRYLRCNRCGARPVNNKWIVPLEFIRRRNR